MAVKVIELHHHGIRIGHTPEGVQAAHDFYRDVLGLAPDSGRPDTIGPGYWMEVDGRAQIHLMGIAGTSKFAPSPDKDPSLPHVALAVEDGQATKKELDRLGVEYWTTRGVTGPELEQVFIKDPAGNLIELHQAGTCRCNKTRVGIGSGMR